MRTTKKTAVKSKETAVIKKTVVKKATVRLETVARKLPVATKNSTVVTRMVAKMPNAVNHAATKLVNR